MKHHDIFICGGGLAGLTASYAFANAGYQVAVCAPTFSMNDGRTTALLNDSIGFLESLGLWSEIAELTHPLKVMRLVDGTKRLFRIQQTEFKSSEIGHESFGYNVRNVDLLRAITSKLDNLTNVHFLKGDVQLIEEIEGRKLLIRFCGKDAKTTDATTGFLVGADGRGSFVRQHFGFEEQSWSYPQSALVVDFEHEHSTNYVSTEFHTESGPFTIVPHNHHKAGLVWLEKPDYVRSISNLSRNELNMLLEEKMGSFLGKVTVCDDVQIFPISGLTARRFGDKNHALVGEAAHVFPPIGAQGFNLGIRDIKTLLDVFNRHTREENRGREYHNKRMLDIKSRTLGVDFLNRSLLSDFLPMQLARTAGIYALKKISPLRKQAMKMGISPNQAN